MAKTESSYYSNLSVMLRDHKKTMLSRDKFFLGCDAEANAAAELEFQEEEIFWTAPDSSPSPACAAASCCEDKPSAKNNSSSKMIEEAAPGSPSPFSISTIHRSSRRALDSLDSGYGLAALSSTTTNNSNNILIMNHHHHHHHQATNKVLFRQQSAPVNVPDWSKILGTSASAAKSSALDNNQEPKKQQHQQNQNKTKNTNNNNNRRKNNNSSSNKSGLLDSSWEDDEEEGHEEQRLPPHELVAREYARSMTFSVYEGAGHTLKGRDLSRVRNAVLKQTGFL